MFALAKERNEGIFSWDLIVDELVNIFHLTNTEKEMVFKSPAARLTAEIAYLSGCNDPERVALAHVGTFIIASKSIYALHKHGENLYNRIAVLDHYPGGNCKIVSCGIIILQLISLYDHKRDMIDDKLIGKPNPLLDGMDFTVERDKLLVELNTVDVDIQELYRMYIEFLPFCWWD